MKSLRNEVIELACCVIEAAMHTYGWRHEWPSPSFRQAEFIEFDTIDSDALGGHLSSIGT